jgi:hypothetical protein
VVEQVRPDRVVRLGDLDAQATEVGFGADAAA